MSHTRSDEQHIKDPVIDGMCKEGRPQIIGL